MSSKDPDCDLDLEHDLDLVLDFDHNQDLDLDLRRIETLKVTYSEAPVCLIFTKYSGNFI